MTPLRINFLLPHAGLAGGTRVVAIYADRLQKRGHDVHVYSTPRKDPGLKKKVKSLLAGKGWPKKIGPSHVDYIDVPRTIIDRWRPMADRDVRDADVTIATWWETAEWLAKLSPSKGAKVNFIQHDERVLASDPERAEAVWGLPMMKVCVAQWLVDLARERDRVAGELAPRSGDNREVDIRHGEQARRLRVELVPNAVDLEQFHAASREKQSTPTVGLMYSLARFKGADVALQAIELARREIPNLRVLAFGTQAPSADMPLPRGTQYQIEPPQDELREIYGSCDAWLFASRSEGFGLPILEAMACRTPVIATPAGAGPEIVGAGGGILVGMEDAEAMGRAIVEIVRKPEEEWRAMSERAHLTATGYTWDDATLRFEQALRDAKLQR